MMNTNSSYTRRGEIMKRKYKYYHTPSYSGITNRFTIFSFSAITQLLQIPRSANLILHSFYTFSASAFSVAVITRSRSWKTIISSSLARSMKWSFSTPRRSRLRKRFLVAAAYSPGAGARIRRGMIMAILTSRGSRLNV